MSFFMHLFMILYQGNWRPERPERPYIFHSQMFIIAMAILVVAAIPMGIYMLILLASFPRMIPCLVAGIALIWCFCQ